MLQDFLKKIFIFTYQQFIKILTMAKSQDAKKTEKKEPLKTAKEKKEEKRIKKNTPKRD